MSASRSIVHLDADAFFASVEQASDPRLRGKPIAVGGETRGIIASASYEARKFGIYTPMPSSQARRLCPRLILLPGDFEKYELFSRLMFSYAYDFTPDVEIGSIDEGYVDLTGVRKPAVSIADTIRRAIRQSLKLSVSEGIGSNKLVSQIASKLHKPAAFENVPTGHEKQFLHPLPNKWLPGIGSKTALRLNGAGLADIGQIAATPVDLLSLLLGRQAPLVRQFANGIDERPLVPAREPQKSFSHQETFEQDVTDEDYVEAVLRRMADRLFAAVREEGRSVRTLTVKVRYNDRDENQRAESLREPTDLETDVYGRLHELLKQAWERRVSLRMVSLKLSNVYEGVFRSELPLEAEAKNHAARERLTAAVDELRRNKTWSVILRAHDFHLRCAHEHPPGLGLRQSPAAFSAPANCPTLSPGQRAGGREMTHPGRPTESPPRSAQFPISNSPAGFDPPSSIQSPVSSIQHPASRIPHIAYIPLRTRSYYTFLDSTLPPAAIVRQAKEYGMPAVALTDIGNLHGAAEFAQWAQLAGIKPIIGTELRVNDHPLLLYVESARGYHNLNRLLSRKADIGAASDEGAVAAQQRRPVSTQTLEPFTEGLVAVSSDTSIAPLFPGRFYQLVTRRMRPGRFPVVACPTIHYGSAADRRKYNIVQSIRTLTLLQEKHPEKRLDGYFHFRTPVEMAIACRDHPEWLAHSIEIADRCHFEMPFGKPQFPAFPPPDGSTPHAFLHRLVYDGLRRRYGARAPAMRGQIEQELNIINAVGYEEYFLDMWSILLDCRAHGIDWITRGSAADSLVCYCLGISDVCPIRFGLYFRRFLNQERMAMNKLPDIDVDFPHDRKDDVVDLIFAKYTRERCAVVGGFSTFQARSAFADVAKVLGVAEREVRRFTEHFPWSFGGGWVPDEPTPSGGSRLSEMLAASPENRDLPLHEEPFKTAIDMAEFLNGFPRNPKMHPCGVVLSRQPIHELTPTFISNKGYPTTHYDMDAVEALGLIKMDILAQGGLAVMRDVTELLRTQKSAQSAISNFQFAICNPPSIPPPGPAIEPPVSSIEHLVSSIQPPASLLAPPSPLPGFPSTIGPFDDPAVWNLISSGQARAVHHIESPAMIGLCRQCNVRDIGTLIAIVSVIRPGAANEGKKLAFTRRYQGLEPITYPDPSLEPVLCDTCGLVVYEEHILQICEAFAGLPPGRADVLRRALNKQKRNVIEEIRLEFFASAKARGHSDQKIIEVWGLVSGFAGYAFCKAHSTAYGVEAYQAAWLKLNYPAEFMAAVLTNGKGFYNPLVYALESYRLGLRFLPPTINEPGPAFTVVKSEIRNPKSETNPNTQKEMFKTRWHETVPNCLKTNAQPPLSSAGGKGSGERRPEFIASVSNPQNHRVSNISPSDFVSDFDARLAFGLLPPASSAQFAISNWQFPIGNSPCGSRQYPESSIEHPVSTLTPHTPRNTSAIRVPVVRTKGLSTRTIDAILDARSHGPFSSLADFFRRVHPTPEEMETLIRAGAFDEFGQSRTHQFWEAHYLHRTFDSDHAPGQTWLLPPPSLEKFPGVPLREPTRRERLQAETELFGYAVSGHPLELFDNVSWETYCPVARLGEFIGQTVVTCGLVIEQRVHHQITGEPMKFLTLADWTGIIETELFAKTYKSYGLATVRYPVLEVTATVEPFENARGYSLRVLRADKPRTKNQCEKTLAQITTPKPILQITG